MIGVVQLVRRLSQAAGDRRRMRRNAALAGACLMAVGMLVVAATAADYGVAWDDYVQTRYGELCLDYFLSGGRDKSCNDFLDLKFYGPGLEMVVAAAARLNPARLIEIRHVLCGAIALLVVVPLVGFGRLLGKPWIGILAAVALGLTPVFYGHAFVNSKDVPFAIGFTWSMFALAAMFARGTYRWREIVVCGLCIGATMSLRPGGAALLLAIYATTAIWCDLFPRAGGRTTNRTLLKQAALALVAWGVMVLPWPWAHENPWLHPLQAIRVASQFHVVVPVLFEGRTIPSDELPRHYLLSLLGLTTPPAILLLAGYGLSRGAASRWRKWGQPRTVVLVVTALWLLVPLVLFVVLRPNAYDGLRHFLFVLPAVAIWSAYGCERLWSRLPLGWQRPVLAGVLGTAAALQVQSHVRLHPYQMTYFNFLAGGVAGAADRYDTECWLTSYKEAIEWIHHQPPPRPGEPVRVLVAANEHARWCADYYAGPHLQISATRTAGQPGDLPAEFDYYVGTTRSAMDENFPLARVVHVVGRAGAAFAVIKRASQDAQRPKANPSASRQTFAAPQL